MLTCSGSSFRRVTGRSGVENAHLVMTASARFALAFDGIAWSQRYTIVEHRLFQHIRLIADRLGVTSREGVLMAEPVLLKIVGDGHGNQ